jgi:hypothetical protein
MNALLYLPGFLLIVFLLMGVERALHTLAVIAQVQVWGLRKGG